jgi:peptidyl-tRNA hydrolase
MKMYILVKDSVPLGFAILAAAHGALAAYLAFRDSEAVTVWLAGPFRKVICKVNEAEFERFKGLGEHVVITESALGGQEVAMAFRPAAEWPKPFQFLRLFR